MSRTPPRLRSVVPGKGYIGTMAPILVLVTVIVVVLARARHIEPV